MQPRQEGRRTGHLPLLILAAALDFGASAVPSSPPAAAPGTGLTPRVVCSSDPSQTYALYLPPTYDGNRPAPILFLLDAGGRAMVPLERFRPGADRYGVILASSYNSASDEAADPNLRALGAMWKDVAARLSLDGARVYLGGFSGTARAACDLALATPGKIAGVIAAGAGFASGHPPTRDTRFAFFGTVGEEDFNYYEMEDLDRLLGELDLPHRVEVFAGGHEWMPADLASEALEWLAMRAAAADPVHQADFLDSSWSQQLAAARRLEAEGRRMEALRAYRNLERDFHNLRDVSEAAAAARRLQALEEIRREEREGGERREREARALEETWRLLGSAVRSSAAPPRPGKLVGDLRITERKRKAGGDDGEAIAARRVLAAIRVQTGYYLPEEEETRGDFRAVALLLTVAAAIDPKDYGITYRLAAAQARAGAPREALRALERSVEAGFDDLDRLRRDPAFDRIRGSSRYRKIEEEMARRREKPASGKSPGKGAEGDNP